MEMEALLKKRPQVVLTNVDLLADSSVKVIGLFKSPPEFLFKS